MSAFAGCAITDESAEEAEAETKAEEAEETKAEEVETEEAEEAEAEEATARGLAQSTNARACCLIS